jgi:ABC-type uncharacterized transport system auxiliary subunit
MFIYTLTCLAGRRLRLVLASIGVTISLAGCAAKEAPLAIRMYNPQTTQTLHCTARDQTGQFTTVIANAVEACARELEARGFVRE